MCPENKCAQKKKKKMPTLDIKIIWQLQFSSLAKQRKKTSPPMKSSTRVLSKIPVHNYYQDNFHTFIIKIISIPIFCFNFNVTFLLHFLLHFYFSLIFFAKIWLTIFFFHLMNAVIGWAGEHGADCDFLKRINEFTSTCCFEAHFAEANEES